MPFVPGTPESRLQRSDSKNPATTCKGLTAQGKHCRRDIASQKSSRFRRNHEDDDGVVAVLLAGDDQHDGAAAYFCWQHKDQAASLTAAYADGRKANIVPIKKRTSVDTLAERLGILDVDEGDQASKSRRKKRHHTQGRSARKETLPQQWQDMDGPLLAVGDGRLRPSRPARQKKKRFCCIEATCEEPLPPSRPTTMAERPNRISAIQQRTPTPHRYSAPGRPNLSTPSKQSDTYTSTQAGLSTPDPPFARPNHDRRRSSQTQTLLTWIPPTLPPTTTSAILSELAKPLSPQDEDGYIYMFWLRDDDHCSSTTTRSPAALITDSTTPSKTASASPRQSGPTPKTILLKIGRAANVQRRMNQWTRQCGYGLDVVRFYPYHASSSQTHNNSAALPPTKVPYSHKVERLIQLQLADQRVKRDCETCGKQHREWFEIEASTKGMRAVDEVCKRWCRWGEMQKGKGKG